jgi:hypothetical protein
MTGFIGIIQTARDYILQLTIAHTLPTVTYLLLLLGSGFQRQTFPFLWIPGLSPVSAISF